jgi:hypothetical protein
MPYVDSLLSFFLSNFFASPGCLRQGCCRLCAYGEVQATPVWAMPW